MRRLGWISTLSSLLTFVGPEVAAQVGSDDEYRALIDDAIREAEGHRYGEALILFREAHEARPSARTLRGIGLMHFELRDYVSAIDVLEGALADPRRPLDEAARAEVETTLSRARAFISTVHITLEPEITTLAIDGREVPVSGQGLLRINPGRHSYHAVASGHLPQTGSLDTDGGEELTLRVALQPDIATPPPEPGVPVEVRGRHPGLQLHAFPLVFGGQQARVGRLPGSSLCTAPCTVRLVPGHYEMGVSRDDGRPLSAGVHDISPTSALELDYSDRSIARGIGWGVLGAGLIALAVLLPTAFTESDFWVGFSALPVSVGTLVLTLVLTLLHDSARVRVVEPPRPR